MRTPTLASDTHPWSRCTADRTLVRAVVTAGRLDAVDAAHLTWDRLRDIERRKLHRIYCLDQLDPALEATLNHVAALVGVALHLTPPSVARMKHLVHVTHEYDDNWGIIVHVVTDLYEPTGQSIASDGFTVSGDPRHEADHRLHQYQCDRVGEWMPVTDGFMAEVQRRPPRTFDPGPGPQHEKDHR